MMTLRVRPSLSLLLLLAAPMSACSPDETSTDDEVGEDDTSESEGDPDESETDTEGPQDEALWFVTSGRLSELDPLQLLAFDLAAGSQAESPQVLLTMNDPSEGLLVVGPTPFGALHVVHGPQGQQVSELIDLDGAGEPVLRPFLPLDLSGSVHEPAFTSEGAAMLAEIHNQGSERLWYVEFDQGQPGAALPLVAEPLPGALPQRHAIAADGSAAVFVLDPDGTGVNQLYWSALPPASDPTPLTDYAAPSTGVDRLELVGDKIIYTVDEDEDGRVELWVRDLDEPLAAPALVSTTLEGSLHDWRWRPDGDALVYQTGDGVYGSLFLIEFDGTQPSSPVRVSGDEGLGRLAAAQPFHQDGALNFQAGPDAQAVMLVDLSQPTPSAPSSVSEVPAGALISNFAFSPSGSWLGYHAGDESSSRVSFVNLSNPAAAQPLHVFDSLPGGYVPIEFIDDQHALVAAAATDERGLYLVDLGANPPTLVRLDEGAPMAWEVSWFARMLTPDHEQVVFDMEAASEEPVRHHLFRRSFAADSTLDQLTDQPWFFTGQPWMLGG